MIIAMPKATTPDSAWRAVLERDPAHDQRFVFAVKTTGIYCRPSCPARRPKRENVEFFDDASTAVSAGYRACLRCRPDRPSPTDPDRIAQARRLIETATVGDPNLTQLAAQVGLSPGHLQRTFKARYGLSPRQFAVARRNQRLRRALKEGATVSRATYDAGFGSSSRLYEAAGTLLGMTPARYAKGGLGQTIRFAVVPTRFGSLLVAGTERGICAVLLGQTREALGQSLRSEFPRATIEPVDLRRDRALADLVDRVTRQFGAEGTASQIPLDVTGTDFQLRVWNALLAIPRGTTRSYAAIARGIGRPRAVRAVASAIGSNRVAVVIPCHRVIREDGSLGGYRWGLKTKQRLLDEERSAG